MTPQQLLAVAAELANQFPDAVLVKNDVGNLAVYDDDTYVGFVDLATGTVEIDEIEGPPVPGEDGGEGLTSESISHRDF